MISLVISPKKQKFLTSGGLGTLHTLSFGGFTQKALTFLGAALELVEGLRDLVSL